MTKRPLIVLSTLLLFRGVVLALEGEPSNPLTDAGSWSLYREDIVGDAELLDGASYFEVDLPERAEDAALVPLRVRQNTDSPPIQSAIVVIDENPAPLAAEFHFSEAMSPLDFETRIRVNQYSNVRVISEIDDKLYMNGRFVKASGGCSAPATKDPEAALIGLGEMRLRAFEPSDALPSSKPRRSAQLMIRHPNYSGLQRDQITQLFIPAHFISEMEVYQGEELLFDMEGGISISENPVFRFDYNDNGDEFIRVLAKDTEGNLFQEKLAKVDLE